MRPRLFVLTGASRGLGAAMARRLLAPEHTLLCLSRQADDALATSAVEAGATLEQWRVDLADAAPVSTRLAAWLGAFDPVRVASASLINNAGALAPIGSLQDASAADLAAALRVGLEAPLLLCAAFLRATASWPADRRILNISSGLGRRAMAGQATYCAAKAGMDQLSRALALEQGGTVHGARIVSLAPGVVDTDMQVQLRAASRPGFPDHDAFVRLKEGGKLASADEAAARVLAYLARSDFGETPVADVRDA
ncbi:MAG: SDR family NAD(P)-dependent oxidoreductase [Caldimonas sp.]